ncbi:hypothetical protein B9Z19DRAFT_685111 [Tuber borchii]|uniref:G domain-containing protein n=1 Tax=Tuber borchii TaxID=42251 RepID=A0A2T6ZA85_TUBBO|nr:hypothetical protein B9Z19DRAFT_685111 [Tuber borchii]
MGMPAAPPMSHTIPSTYFLAKPPIPSTIVPPIDNPKKEIIIAVMGPAGAGKSYFIREMIAGISQSDIELCETSGWTKVRSFSFPYGPTKITLFDTPDFRNAGTGDYEMLAEISDWMSSAYRQGTLLSGIIYLHNIHWLHENFWATEHLMMFQKLCGPSALQNVLLTTTQWSNANLAAEESRENTLRTSSHWRELITGGAAVKRFMGTRESGLELIDQLIKKEPKPLLIQHQMVDEDMILEETDVGQCMGWT